MRAVWCSRYILVTGELGGGVKDGAGEKVGEGKQEKRRVLVFAAAFFGAAPISARFGADRLGVSSKANGATCVGAWHVATGS